MSHSLALYAFIVGGVAAMAGIVGSNLWVGGAGIAAHVWGGKTLGLLEDG